MLRRFSVLVVSVAMFALAFTVGSAAAGSGSGGGERSAEKPVKVDMSVEAKRFRVIGKRVVARGPMTLRADERGPDGVEETLKQRVQMRVTASGKGGGACKVITLHLAELNVELLGLLVNTSEVNLDVKGARSKALGKLFCKLSQGLKLDKKSLARRAAHSLNQRIADREMNVLAVNARMHPQQTSAAYADSPVCTILDLDLGPLELDLLGLLVHLYGDTKKKPVHVDADADPNGGVLGELLCELSGGPSEEQPQTQG